MEGSEPLAPTSGFIYSRRGLHGQVVEALGRRIVHGEIEPGATIDVDQLETEYAVSRTVVREAVKVLSAKGLLDARPKRGTFVRDRRHWNLLDADVMTWRDEGQGIDLQLLHDLDEVRQAVEPRGAGLAAQRRTLADLAEIDAALARLVETADGDLEDHVRADLAFHRAVLSASQNELLLRMEIIIEPALRARNALAFSEEHGREFLDAHAQVRDAIAAQDGEAAQRLMEGLLVDAAADTEAILARRKRARRRRSG